MHWLLLPVAAVTLILGLRTPSAGLMILWLTLTLIAVALWFWIRYRMLFPVRDADPEITPLDPAELARLREQARLNREAEAAARAAAEAEALHPIHPITPTLQVADAQAPAADDTPTPVPAPAIERPITGRAVFAVPDDVPPRTPTVEPGDRPL